MSILDSVKKFQDQLIVIAKESNHHNPLSEKVLEAFYSVPRHKFVKKYRAWRNPEWLNVTEQNLEEHLASIYSDHPLALHGEDKEFLGKEGTVPVSTISQPSFVLRMIDILKLEEVTKYLSWVPEVGGMLL